MSDLFLLSEAQMRRIEGFFPQQSQLVHQPGSGACPDIRRSSKPSATPISSRSVFPKSVRPPKPNSVEPPWYGTRMPGGVGGVASRGVPYPDQSPSDSAQKQDALALALARLASR